MVESVPADEETDAYPLYIPTPIERANPGNEAESPIPREGDILDLPDDNMSVYTPTKRSRESKDEGQQKSKKTRGDAVEGLPVDVRDLSER